MNKIKKLYLSICERFKNKETKIREFTQEEKIQHLQYYLYTYIGLQYYRIYKKVYTDGYDNWKKWICGIHDIDKLKELQKHWITLVYSYLNIKYNPIRDNATLFLYQTMKHIFTEHHKSEEQMNIWWRDTLDKKEPREQMQLNWIPTLYNSIRTNKPYNISFIQFPVSVRLKIYTDKEFPFDIEYEKSDTNKMTVEKYTNDTLVSKRKTNDIFDIYKQLAIEGVLYSDKWRYYEQYSNLKIWED